MQHILSLSYGKDSIKAIDVCYQYGLSLDYAVHVEVMATPTIPADLPEMMEFKKYADKILLKRYGLKVEHIRAKKSFEECFYQKYTQRSKYCGQIWGFPQIKGNWCNSQLKVNLLNKICKDNITYLGIAFDEPNRFHNLSDIKISPLVEHNITEQQCYNWCKDNDLLSPIYKNAMRGGCWFCHNQSKDQLRLLRNNYPQYWDLMMKWDLDSPVTFKPNGMTIHDFENLFELEDRQTTLF